MGTAQRRTRAGRRRPGRAMRLPGRRPRRSSPASGRARTGITVTEPEHAARRTALAAARVRSASVYRGSAVDDVEGARTFAVAGQTYDLFMGRYSVPLAERFADSAGVLAGDTALDVGCGPCALTGVLVSRLGPNAVYACDPSPPFRDACATRHPGVVVELGRAESIPLRGPHRRPCAGAAGAALRVRPEKSRHRDGASSSTCRLRRRLRVGLR